ncbi:MAG: S9 family peptidase, partial [Bacteroidales bacterium]|nr:S9 family peptidase [Bacteroidales bacterium]
MHAPIAQKHKKLLKKFGITRQDDYYWLNQRDTPDVIDYLRQENAYTDEMMKDKLDLQEELFLEMKNRIKENDSSVPYLNNGYWYFTKYEKGKEYPIYCRSKCNVQCTMCKKDRIICECLKKNINNKNNFALCTLHFAQNYKVILDVNLIADGHKFCSLGEIMISDNNELMAYSVDFNSRRIYDIYVVDLKNNEIIDKIGKTTGDFVWAADNKTLFYTTQNRQLRADKVWRVDLSKEQRAKGRNNLVFFEKNAKFDVGLCRTKSEKYIFIYSDSTLSTEFRYIEAIKPNSKFKIFLKREEKHEYDIDHRGNEFFIITNWQAKNFRLMKCPIKNTSKAYWEEIIPHREDVKLEDYELFQDFLVLEERKNALNNIRVLKLNDSTTEQLFSDDFIIPTNEELYDISCDINPDFNTHTLRYAYTSLTTPITLYEIDLGTKEVKLLKQQEVLDPNFKPENYVSKRLWATSHDGVKVPISIVFRAKTCITKAQKTIDDSKSLDSWFLTLGSILLYGYGSYGYSLDVCFNSTRLSLLDRGVVFAIAHVRGGEEMGRNWYEDGKFLKKKNTFLDFIACAEYLSKNALSPVSTQIPQIIAMGGSAGGLLTAAVANMRPDLFKGIVSEVPFVDVLTTMLDEDIPLTIGEYDEWGNPNEKEYFDYILSYSPYDNIARKNYPPMLVT